MPFFSFLPLKSRKYNPAKYSVANIAKLSTRKATAFALNWRVSMDVLSAKKLGSAI